MAVVTVTPCNAATAKQCVESWHYSHRMPRGAQLIYACREDGRFIGVVIFGVGVGKPVLHELKSGQWLELQRVAFRDHVAPVSQHVAAAMRRIREHHSAVRLIVSFADPHQGHHGGIYQAGGWIYSGESAPSVMYRSPHGELYHSRVVSNSGRNKQFGAVKRAWRKEVFEPVRVPGKHRYLYPLDKAMRRRIAKLAKPYPSRGRSVDGDASGSRPEEAGSTPAARSDAVTA